MAPVFMPSAQALLSVAQGRVDEANFTHGTRRELEYWSDGVLFSGPIIPTLQYSITPFFYLFVGTALLCASSFRIE